LQSIPKKAESERELSIYRAVRDSIYCPVGQFDICGVAAFDMFALKQTRKIYLSRSDISGE
jgi:hypothetical protein